jgi:hypothetical protein
MTNDDLSKCQASSAEAVATLPEMVKTSAGKLGFLDDGKLNTDTDALFDRMNKAGAALTAANDLIQAETPRVKRGDAAGGEGANE